MIDATPGKFFWGIPHSDLGGHLAWTTGSLHDEARDIDLKIPSWSWFGYKGLIGMGHVGELPLSFLAVYRWRNDCLERICTLTALSLPPYPHDDGTIGDHVIWRDASEWAVNLEDIPQNVVLNEDQLIFWTYVVSGPTAETEFALVAQQRDENWPHLFAVHISLSNGVAKRIYRPSSTAEEWWSRNAVKKLIILE